MSSVICVGDFGTGEEGQYEVAKLIKYLIQIFKCKLVLGLGDNFYPDGVKSVNDKQFIDKFEIPYSILPKNIKFFNVLGNHDYHLKNSPNAQVEYFFKNKKNSRWVLPHNFYCFSKKINSIPVEFIALDTNIKMIKKKVLQKQEVWVLNTLYESKARWNIVYGHHPWKSYGEHGNCEEDEELDKLYKKMILTKKVDLFISGHDHNQQHIYIPNKPNMIISGVGSKTRKMPFNFNIYDELKYSSSNLGCCVIEFGRNVLKISFFNTNKEREYSFEIHKKK